MSKEANASTVKRKACQKIKGLLPFTTSHLIQEIEFSNDMNGDQKPTASRKDIPVKRMPHLQELMDLNKLWKQEYDLLQKKFEQEKGDLQEDNYKLKQEVQRSELRCSKLETKNLTLQSELVRLARAFESIHPHQTSVSKETGEEMEEVELIREQLDAYKEDFKLEHQDKEKIQSEKQSLQEKLLQCEKHMHTLNKELELYKKECKRLHGEKGRPKLSERHPSIDRSLSCPSTTSFSQTDIPFGSVSKVAMPPCIGENADGFLNLEDFRHEQYKRGILVRNPTQTRPRPQANLHPTLRRLSDSLPPDSTNKSCPSSNRTSCLW